jgi:hypothetical protein
MPEITFTRDTGSYTNGATVDMGAGTAAHLVQHGAAEYTNGAKPKPKPSRAKRAAPKAKLTPPAGKGTPDSNEGSPTPE